MAQATYTYEELHAAFQGRIETHKRRSKRARSEIGREKAEARIVEILDLADFLGIEVTE